MDKGQATSDKIKVLVGIPRGGFTLTEAVDNQIDMAAYLGKLQVTSNFEFHFATIGRLFVPKAREEFVRYTLEIGADYLFMVDDDMICPLNLFELLYRHQVDIVAPLAFQRRTPHLPVIYKTRTGYDTVRKEPFFSNEIVKTYPKDTLFECDAVGFGAVLIKRWVLEKLESPMFMSTSPTGEDILFCYNAKEKANAKVFCDTSTKLVHLGHPLMIDEVLYEKTNGIDHIRKTYGDCNDEMFNKVGEEPKKQCGGKY